MRKIFIALVASLLVSVGSAVSLRQAAPNTLEAARIPVAPQPLTVAREAPVQATAPVVP
jgi:hypothetical protein